MTPQNENTTHLDSATPQNLKPDSNTETLDIEIFSSSSKSFQAPLSPLPKNFPIHPSKKRKLLQPVKHLHVYTTKSSRDLSPRSRDHNTNCAASNLHSIPTHPFQDPVRKSKLNQISPRSQANNSSIVTGLGSCVNFPSASLNPSKRLLGRLDHAQNLPTHSPSSPDVQVSAFQTVWSNTGIIPDKSVEISNQTNASNLQTHVLGGSTQNFVPPRRHHIHPRQQVLLPTLQDSTNSQHEPTNSTHFHSPRKLPTSNLIENSCSASIPSNFKPSSSPNRSKLSQLNNEHSYELIDNSRIQQDVTAQVKMNPESHANFLSYAGSTPEKNDFRSIPDPQSKISTTEYEKDPYCIQKSIQQLPSEKNSRPPLEPRLTKFNHAFEKSDTVSSQALQISKQLFTARSHNSSSTSLTGFITGTVKSIPVSSKALAQSVKLLKNENKNQAYNASKKDDSRSTQMTAFSKDLNVSSKTLVESTNILNTENENLANTSIKDGCPSILTTGFMTGSGKGVHVSSKALARSTNLLSTENKDLEHDEASIRHNCPSGKGVNVSSKTLVRSTNLSSTENGDLEHDVEYKRDECPSILTTGFMTGSGKGVHVSSKALMWSTKLLTTENEGQKNIRQSVESPTKKSVQISPYTPYSSVSLLNSNIPNASKHAGSLMSITRMNNELKVSLSTTGDRSNSSTVYTDMNVLNSTSVSHANASKEFNFFDKIDPNSLVHVGLEGDQDQMMLIENDLTGFLDVKKRLNFDTDASYPISEKPIVSLNQFQNNLSGTDFPSEDTANHKTLSQRNTPSRNSKFRTPRRLAQNKMTSSLFPKKKTSRQGKLEVRKAYFDKTGMMFFKLDKDNEADSTKFERENFKLADEGVTFAMSYEESTSFRFTQPNLFHGEFSSLCDMVSHFFPSLSEQAVKRIFDSVESVGLKEVTKLLQELFEMSDADNKIGPTKLGSIPWTKCVYSLAVMQLAGLVNQCSSPILSFQALLNIMCHRIDDEWNKGKQAPLLRMVRQDTHPGTPTVILVLEANHNRHDLTVTDGWFTVQAKTDKHLSNWVRKGVISPGVKLFIAGAKLEPIDSQFSDELSQNILKLHINGTRRAPESYKLGNQRHEMVHSGFRDLHPDGGIIPGLNVIVQRIYPLKYVEKQEEKVGDERILTIIRTEEEELQATERWYAKMESSFDSDNDRQRKSLQCRNVIPMLDMIVSDMVAQDFAIVSIWRPDLYVVENIKEGSVVNMNHLELQVPTRDLNLLFDVSRKPVQWKLKLLSGNHIQEKRSFRYSEKCFVSRRFVDHEFLHTWKAGTYFDAILVPVFVGEIQKSMESSRRFIFFAGSLNGKLFGVEFTGEAAINIPASIRSCLPSLPSKLGSVFAFDLTFKCYDRQCDILLCQSSIRCDWKSPRALDKMQRGREQLSLAKQRSQSLVRSFQENMNDLERLIRCCEHVVAGTIDWDFSTCRLLT